MKVVATLYLPNVDMGEGLVEGMGAEFVKRLCRSGERGREAEDELIAATHDADAVLTNLQPFTRRVIERLPRCKVLCAIGIGYDWIDVDAATEFGICVTNVPTYCLEEVSDHAMALLLACARKLTRVFAAVKAGMWDAAVPVKIRHGIQRPMFRLRGQTLGLIGFGNIARTLVPKAKGFGLRVIACDPYVPKEVAEGFGVELVELDSLLRQADFVSVHAVLTKETHHMLTLEHFRKMKPTAYFINTARGALVDEQGLYAALKEGCLAGAALDVLESEPPGMDNPLFGLDNVLITPHMAQFSDQAEAELWRAPAEEAVRVLRGEWPRALVNPQVKERFVARWGEPGK